MNSISNIEIINFDEIENEEHHSMDLEQEIGINYMNNMIIEKYESEYSETQTDLNGFDFCNITECSDTPSQLLNKKLNYDSCNNSNFGDQTNYSENIKSNSFNESFSNLEKITNNSFSYLKKSTKFKINIDNESNISNISSFTSKNFPCTFEGCEKIYKSKENLTLHFKNIHLKEKPYSCKFCNSVFSHRNGKTYHERKFHTKFLPHKCSFENCLLSFASKSALSYHLKSQHNNKKNSRIHKSKFNEKIMEMVGFSPDDTNDFN